MTLCGQAEPVPEQVTLTVTNVLLMTMADGGDPFRLVVEPARPDTGRPGMRPLESPLGALGVGP